MSSFQPKAWASYPGRVDYMAAAVTSGRLRGFAYEVDSLNRDRRDRVAHRTRLGDDAQSVHEKRLALIRGGRELTSDPEEDRTPRLTDCAEAPPESA